MTITQAELRALLRYDPATGVFTRLLITNTKQRLGEVVGSPDVNGYIVLRLKGRDYKAHRLAWFYVRGVWPTAEIDHKNNLVADNSFENLRDATRAVNQQNRRGTKGYTRDRGRWKASIKVAKRRVHLGMFATEAEAGAAYAAAKAIYHQETPRVAR